MNRHCMLAESIRKEFRARGFEPFYGGMYVTTARLLEHGLIEPVVHEGRPVRVETYTMYRFIRSALKSEGLL